MENLYSHPHSMGMKSDPLQINRTVKSAWLGAFSIALLGVLTCCSSEPKLLTPHDAFDAKPAYDYPINNPYAATIITTPPEMRVDYSALPAPAEKKITIFKDRQIPEGFWYENGFKYRQMLQSKPAPLVYVIGGTGAGCNAEDTQNIANILYSAGFNVVLLPSPTHPNFIINASENFTPGRPLQDARDMYRVMKLIDPLVASQTHVTQRMLIGYSLGGLDALFTAKLDDEEKALNFHRVLLINPPLNLYSSIKLIDSYLYRALPQGVNGAARFIKSFLSRLSNISQSTDALDFSNERLLLEAYDKYQPSDNRLETTIGLSFRLAAADMAFTADVMSHAGYIFPKNQPFTSTTSLNDYLAVALRTSFQNYFDEYYTERLLAENPSLSRQGLIDEGNLQSLAGYISASGKIALITNKDDIILMPGEVNALAALFGPNAVVFPNGGHLGNLTTPAVGYQIIQFMRN